MKFENENWAQFKGETWKKEINVRDFIQNNYKPYNGDDTFLVPSSEKTKKVWNKLTEMFKVEREKGVYDAETKLPQGIDTYGPGYIDKENEVIVGLQTDAPLKRGIFPKGGIRMVENSLEAYGYHLDPMTKEIFTKYRKTHNEGVFSAYTDEMLATIFRRKETTVKMALDTFEKFGMIQRIDGVLTIPNWGKHQTLDQLEKKREYQRDYMRDYRAKQKEIADKTYCKANSNANVSSLEEDIDIEEDKEYITVSKDTVRQTEVRQCVEAWNSLSEYGIKTISRLSSSSQRYQRLSARIKEYGLPSVLSAIEKVKGSSFLQGKSSGKKAWVITFDWFVLPNNFPKVLDGNYDDHPDNQKSDVEQGNQKWKPASKLAADEWQ